MSKETKHEVAVYDQNQSRFLALRPENEMMEAMEANGESVSFANLTKVKTPSGDSTTWMIDTPYGEPEATRDICGAFVLYQKQGLLWPSDEFDGSGAKPVLKSFDMRTAFRVDDTDDIGDLDEGVLAEAELAQRDQLGRRQYDLSKLHYNQWGSGNEGSGKRFKEQRVLGILPFGEMLPLIITVQPGSLASVTKTIGLLQVPHYRTIVHANLLTKANAKGVKYPQINLTFEREFIQKPESDILKQRYTDPLKSAMLAEDVSFEE